MQKIHAQFALCLCLTAFLFSCSKTENNVSTVETYSSMNDVFGKLSLQPKVLTVDAATGGSFFGNSGTRYYFIPNSFQTAIGASVTGNIQIAVTEYLQKGDMIFSKMLPVSNGVPIVSGGEVTIYAKQGSQEIFLKPGFNCYISIPTVGTPPTGMQLFTGQPVVDTSIMKTNWILPQRDSSKYNVGVFVFMGIPYGDTLNVISDSLRSINCDYFLGLGAADLKNCTLSITATGVDTASTKNALVYAIFDNKKLIYPMYRSYGSPGITYSLKNVPADPIHFVAFTLVNGQFYGGTLKATPASGANFNLNLLPQDAKAFKAQLNGL